LIQSTVDDEIVNYQLLLETCRKDLETETASEAKSVIDDFEQVDQWFNEHLLNALDISDKL
jgi:hypothetical protein